MTEAILPGVLIEVRPEGLIIPGAVTVGNLGVVGTAAKGAVGVPQLLGSYTDAVQRFGPYDRWVDGTAGELTLVRALEQAYRFGATTVWAVRVADFNEKTATVDLEFATDPTDEDSKCVRIEALSPGTWGNDITVEVSTADADAVVSAEEGDGTALAHKPVVQSAVNRIIIRPSGGGADRVAEIVYGTTDTPGPNPTPTQIKVNTETGALTFGTPLANGEKVLATYMVAKESAVKVTVKAGLTVEEVYRVVSGNDLIADLKAGSALVEATTPTDLEFDPAKLPNKVKDTPLPLTGGANGAAGADYSTGLEALLAVDAHIIITAGQDESFGDELAAHCAVASGDEIKRDRIAIVGAALDNNRPSFLSTVSKHTLNSDRVVFVAPGIGTSDRSQSPPVPVVLPGAYAAAAVGGLLSSQPAHISLTNKVLPVDSLEHDFTSAELKQLVLSRVLALEKRQGFRIVKGITTSTLTAFAQITTRRIVDFAKFGVRSAATPYIGLLNNERVRGALRATINSFLTDMVEKEMLVSYQLDVHASRADEIRGRALVDLVLRPTFSIDFIKVTMFLE